MTLFLILLAIFGLLYLPAVFGVRFLPTHRAKMRVALGISFVIAGILHFIIPNTFLLLVPPFLPLRLEAVYVSGIFEILGGVGLMIPRLERASAFGLIALLIAVFPANIYMALANVQVGGYMNSPIYQWIRLPFQFVLIWLVWWSALSKKRGEK
jgi:uncharacterized membrane protein